MSNRKGMLTNFSRTWAEYQSKITARIAAMPFEAVGASARTTNAFKKNININTVGDVVRMTPTQIMNFPRVGPCVIEDLQESMGVFLNEMLKEEQKPEIQQQEKIVSVFQSYIAGKPRLDILRSEKVGYLYIDFDSDGNHILDADIFSSAEELCSRLYLEVALDGENCGVDLCMMTEEQKGIVRGRLAQYSDKLPEYEHLIDELFLPPEQAV